MNEYVLVAIAIGLPVLVIVCAAVVWWCERMERTCPDTQKPCNEFCEPHKGDRCARTGEDIDPWGWIPHKEGADRQVEINAHLRSMADSLAMGRPLRWNPNTSQMEPYDHLDDLGMKRKP